MVVKFNHVDHGGSIIPEIDIAGLTAGEVGKISRKLIPLSKKTVRENLKRATTLLPGNRPGKSRRILSKGPNVPFLKIYLKKLKPRTSLKQESCVAFYF